MLWKQINNNILQKTVDIIKAICVSLINNVKLKQTTIIIIEVDRFKIIQNVRFYLILLSTF